MGHTVSHMLSSVFSLPGSMVTAGLSTLASGLGANLAQKRAQPIPTYPSSDLVKSLETGELSKLGQARLSSYHNMANELAARGFGPGSGYAAERAGEIESSYLKSIGDLATNLTQFAATPFKEGWWTKAPGMAETMYGSGADYLSMASGLGRMSNLLRPGSTSTTSSPMDTMDMLSMLETFGPFMLPYLA